MLKDGIHDWIASLGWVHNLHGVSDENTLIHLLLLNEFLDVVGHRTIIVFRGMERLSMVP